ncbi:tripartite tricarboxylate transporter substrate binding protein [Hydrogenophaga intermedia]|uniref:tripartite tricarboxylate transporter substrate binding protein n=1 Tax=Hydrogenophaga intermedia TaxID=65786 RepID=UPI0020445D79|nr:tripartite tricarboxylate transporter substrate binding protein [Hydrogenophaga intermedia]MCM3562842.1 tripartite tricarboxylate transporter substrate binding protein [Hydrogenophaga intermedia]
MHTDRRQQSAPDVAARVIGRFLAEELRQPVVVENRVGAAGNVGVEYVVRAAPDGYTLLYSPGSTITMNPHLYQFDMQKELVPVAATSLSPLPLVVRADLPIHSVNDLIAYAKQNPGKLTYGSSGTGSPLHVAAELLLSGAGIKAVHVPYKGSAQTTNALLAKEVDFAFDAGVASPHVKAGKLRYLALASSTRSPNYPGLPTVREAAGFPVDVSVPSAILAPPGTPPDIVARLNQTIGRIMGNPAFRDAIAVINSSPPPAHLSPSELAASFRSYTDRFGAAIRATNIPRQ